MRSMVIDRRAVLGMLGAGLLRPAALLASMSTSASVLAGEADDHGALFLAARKRANRFEAAVFDEAGNEHRVIALPDRGHSFAVDGPRRRAVAFGRQPGFYALAFDIAGHHPPLPIAAAKGRHFFGHGAFSPDGTRMFATENDYEEGRSVIGVYDASTGGGFRRVGEFGTAGIGAHEVVLMPDGRTLCVANGGLLTHPDYGKQPLNLADMKPSLAYIDAHTGALLEQQFLDPELHQLSLRHLVVDSAGDVWFGCQYMGAAAERPPLVGRHRPGSPPELLAMQDETLRAMKNYVGSVGINAAGTIVATSSPVGGRILFWDIKRGKVVNEVTVHDGCGVAGRAAQGFLISSGEGRLFSVDGRNHADPLRSADQLAWDNHLRRI